MSTLFIVVLAIIYLLYRYFPAILDRKKKLESIPSLPGRLPIFGHVLAVVKMVIFENYSPTHAFLTFLDKTIPVGKDNGEVLAFHLGPIATIVNITSPEAAENDCDKGTNERVKLQYHEIVPLQQPWNRIGNSASWA